MTPDQINAEHGQTVYRCRVCQAETGLRWFGGTSCPVCSNPACSEALEAEVAAWHEQEAYFQAEYEALYGR